MSNKLVQIEAMQYSVTKIDFFFDGEYIGSASGFFYNHEEELYLVTCKHCFYSDKFKKMLDMINIRVHTSITSNIDNRIIEIPLYVNDKHLWIEHPIRKDIDIAIIKIQEFIKPTDHIRYWSKEHIVTNGTFIGIGEQVMILGYPKQFYDKMHNLPIGRTGNIASTFGADFDGHPFFLIEGNLHSGTSGSPVII